MGTLWTLQTPTPTLGFPLQAGAAGRPGGGAEGRVAARGCQAGPPSPAPQSPAASHWLTEPSGVGGALTISTTDPCLGSSALLAVPLGGPSLGDWGLELDLGLGLWQEGRQHEGSAVQKEVP